MGTNSAEMNPTLRAVVVDDEPLAREYLKLMLLRIGNIEIVGECGGAAECLRSIADVAPDVVFLDIRLPDNSGMEVAKVLTGLKKPPQIVFTTGYDDYAVPAFEVAAVDYIMKPFDQERLEKTLRRVRSRLLPVAETAETDAQIKLGKLAIRDKDGCKLVPTDDICFIRTHNRKTSIHTAGKVYASHYTLGELEQKLCGHRFFRANEGCLVNMDRVKEIVYYGPRTYELLLTEPKEVFIPLSRSRAQKLREMLGF